MKNKKILNNSNPASGAVKSNALENPLDWYVLTERFSSILNDLIAYAGRERFLELKKANPDQNRIEKLREFSNEIRSVNRNSDNFKDAGRMKQIIALYGPQLKKVNMGEQLV